MNTLQRTAFAFVLTWSLLDAFTPGAPYNQRVQLSLLMAGSMGYFFGLHVEFYRWIKRVLKGK